ncbi:MAG: 50S ribosomal protein L11 methyltransferase [Xanthobacteraceae bacterium]
MTPAPGPDTATTVARLAAEGTSALRILDGLAEVFDSTEAVVSAFETGPGQWTVAIHFRAPPNQSAVRALVAMVGDADAANALVFEPVEAKDWVKASLDGLPPVEAGRFVVHGAHDRMRIRPNRIGIEIEAALAFGTGHHGTTRGCLLALDRIAKARRPGKVLDLGTGSGVLAIAAARRLRTSVLASDIDPGAVRIARHNARRNRADAEFIQARGVTARRLRARVPYDLVLANILLGPLQRLATPLARLVAPGGRIVLSGLLTTHANAALAAYRTQGFALDRRIVLEDWATLVLRAPPRTRSRKRRM